MGRILVVFLLLSCQLVAQDKLLKQPMFNDIEVTNSITKSYHDSTCVFQVKVMNDSHDPDRTKRYYWFHQGEIRNTMGNYTGKLLHGTFEKFDRDGILLEKGNFKYGLKEGAWIRWYGNGNMAQYYEWRQGQRKGKFEEYFADGSLLRSGSYKEDKLNGKLISYTKEGATLNEARYRNGILQNEKSVRESKKVPKTKKIKALPSAQDTTTVERKIKKKKVNKSGSKEKPDTFKDSRKEGRRKDDSLDSTKLLPESKK